MTPNETCIILNMIPGVGSARLLKLLDVFGCPEVILEAPIETLRQIHGIGPEIARNIASWRSVVNLDKELESIYSAGANVTTIFDDTYPASLRNAPDAPIVLYSYGQWLPVDSERSISIVGSRMASSYGRICARTIAHDLAEYGISIISGLALGVDTMGHEGALDAGGRTIAVIGSGLNHIFPKENLDLAHRIVDMGGAIVSEYPMNQPPKPKNFPRRNRIVSSWGTATLLIEAPVKSGSLITARMANERGKNVFCVPGNITSATSEGTHALIRDGGILIRNAQDIIDDMGWAQAPTAKDNEENLPLFNYQKPSRTKSLLSSDEQTVLTAIRRGYNTIDSLCTALGLPAYELTPILAKLQIGGHITPDPGGFFFIND